MSSKKSKKQTKDLKPRKRLKLLEAEFLHDRREHELNIGSHSRVLAQQKRTLGELHRDAKNMNSALAHLMNWAMEQGYKPPEGTAIKRRITGEAIDPSDARREVVGMRDQDLPPDAAHQANHLRDLTRIDPTEGLQGRTDEPGGSPGDDPEVPGTVAPSFKDWGWLRYREREVELAEREARLGIVDPDRSISPTPPAVAHRLERTPLSHGFEDPRHDLGSRGPKHDPRVG